ERAYGGDGDGCGSARSTAGTRRRVEEAVDEVEEVLAVGVAVVIEVRVVREEVIDEVEEVLAVDGAVVVPVAGAGRRRRRADAEVVPTHDVAGAAAAEEADAGRDGQRRVLSTAEEPADGLRGSGGIGSEVGDADRC